MLIHREALELSRNAAIAVDGTPFTITCVNITTDGAVVVTDGKHWLRMKAATEEPNLFDEIAEQGTDALDGPVMIPAEVVQAFNAAMKKRKPKKGQSVPHVVVAQEDNRVTLKSSDGKTTRSFLMEAVDKDLTFPDVDYTVAAHKPQRHVIFSVDLLSVVLRTLRACKADSVTFGFPEDSEAVVSLTAFTATGPIDGAVMPMRKNEASEAAA